MTELPERRGFDPAAQKNFDALKNRLTTVETAGYLTAPVADTSLASPNNSVYRNIKTDVGWATGLASVSTAKFVFGPNGTNTFFWSTGASGTVAPDLIYLDDADYAVAGKSTKLRVRAQVITNATAPAITITFGLYPLSTAGGGAGALTFSIGTVVSGSTVAFSSPSASTFNQNNSGDFTFPSDDYYALGVVGSGSQAANSFLALTAQLQMRHV